MLEKQIPTTLTLFVLTAWFVAFTPPAKAAPLPQPSGTESRPALCMFLPALARAGDRLPQRPLGRQTTFAPRRQAQGRRRAIRRQGPAYQGWVAVTPPAANPAGPPPNTAEDEDRPILRHGDPPCPRWAPTGSRTCTRTASSTVRSAATPHSHRVGKLKVADGRFAGACQPTKGWVAVNSSQGKPGWASAKYLRNITGK